jgi:hypothetical protein
VRAGEKGPNGAGIGRCCPAQVAIEVNRSYLGAWPRRARASRLSGFVSRYFAPNAGIPEDRLLDPLTLSDPVLVGFG